MEAAGAMRPTKKQRALLDFIEQFITEHGYSPSYREIMNGCSYNSIATVAVHINNLISRGHLRKRDHSARSLELTRLGASDPAAQTLPEQGTANEHSQPEAWLLARAEALFDKYDHEDIATVVQALQLLDLSHIADQLADRLDGLQSAESENVV